MAQSIDSAALKDAVKNKRIEWQKHALERMAERNILRSMVIKVLLTGERIEDYPNNTPFPSALFYKLIEQRPIHVVAAYDSLSKSLFVITAYEPDLEHFEPDFKTRRKK